MKHLKIYISLTLKISKLNENSLSLQVYFNALFATNEGLLSQLRYLIFLKAGSNKCQLLFWTSYKTKKINCSVLGRKSMALQMYLIWLVPSNTTFGYNRSLNSTYYAYQ